MKTLTLNEFKRYLILFFYLLMVHFTSLGQSFPISYRVILTDYVKSDSKVENNYIGGVNEFLIPVFNSTFKLKYDFQVSNKAEFMRAIKVYKPNQIIFIKGESKIDLSDIGTLTIDRPVTIIGTRGINNSKGPELFSKSRPRPLINILSDNVSIIGLRINGYDYDRIPKGADVKKHKGKIAYIKPVSEGIIIKKGKGIKIWNCEIFGWSHAGIYADKKASNISIKYSYFHNNQREGLGYGIAVNGTSVDIQANLFIENRHDIASTGINGSSYTASNNIVIGDKDDHSFDMHGGIDRKDGTNLAGTKIDIYSNYFFIRKSARAFVIRGIPSQLASFRNNYIYEFKHSVNSRSLKSNLANENLIDDVVGQRNSSGKIEVKNNKKILLK